MFALATGRLQGASAFDSSATTPRPQQLKEIQGRFLGWKCSWPLQIQKKLATEADLPQWVVLGFLRCGSFVS